MFATQTALEVATSALAPAPTGTVATTSLFSGLMRETVPLPLLATQTEPSGPIVTATGSLPTGICVITCVFGSILDSVPDAALATQIAPSPPTATLVGWAVTGTADVT